MGRLVRLVIYLAKQALTRDWSVQVDPLKVGVSVRAVLYLVYELRKRLTGATYYTCWLRMILQPIQYIQGRHPNFHCVIISTRSLLAKKGVLT